MVVRHTGHVTDYHRTRGSKSENHYTNFQYDSEERLVGMDYRQSAGIGSGAEPNIIIPKMAGALKSTNTMRMASRSRLKRELSTPKGV